MWSFKEVLFSSWASETGVLLPGISLGAESAVTWAPGFCTPSCHLYWEMTSCSPQPFLSLVTTISSPASPQHTPCSVILAFPPLHQILVLHSGASLEAGVVLGVSFFLLYLSLYVRVDSVCGFCLCSFGSMVGPACYSRESGIRVIWKIHNRNYLVFFPVTFIFSWSTLPMQLVTCIFWDVIIKINPINVD